MTEDEIAALDGEWERVPPMDRAAFQYTLKLTRQPHLVGPGDMTELLRRFNPLQAAEITQAVAGYNATNRWTDALNIPAEETGAFFRKTDSTPKDVDLDTFLTPTSQAFAKQVSGVAPLKSEYGIRPPLEPFEEIPKKIEALGKTNQPAYLGGEAGESGWVRYLKLFPVANKGRISTLLAAETKGQLDNRTKLIVAWTSARQDRAWYMLDLIGKRFSGAGINVDELRRIDADSPELSAKDKAVINLSRKMAVAPWTISDADVAVLRKHYNDYQVAEIVLHGCNASYLDRITIAAGLPSDSPSKEKKP